MTLTDTQIEKFQLLHKKYFGVDITKEQALESGLKLVNLIRLVYRPLEKNYNENQEFKKNQES